MIVFRIAKLRTKTSYQTFFFILLALFILIFPKGGIKIYTLPITWGYLILGFLSLLLLLRKTYRINKNHLAIFLSFIPFQIISLISILINGYSHIGFTISFFLNFFIFSFIFFLILSEYIQEIDIDLFFKIIKKGIFFLALYGIFLFIYKIITKSFIEIPFLTINYHDLGNIENKHINRGEIFKLISTYNNGNLFGMCLLMLLPLYKVLEKNIYKRSIVKLSLIFTLSRTVWIALLFCEILTYIFLNTNKKISIYKSIFFTLIISSCIGLFIYIYNFSFLWLFDPTVGGRLENFAFSNIKFFSSSSFYGISEMVYLSILENFGIFGLLAFLLALFSPLFLLKINSPIYRNKNLPTKAIIIGLITYLFCAISDGGILLIPIMVFYYFLSSILFCKKIEALPKADLKG